MSKRRREGEGWAGNSVVRGREKNVCVDQRAEKGTKKREGGGSLVDQPLVDDLDSQVSS